VVDGQFSGPFVIACALATGRMTWDSYGLLHDDAIRALLPRIACQPDADAQREFPANMSGKLTVVADGAVWERFVRVPKGEPSNFMTDAELRAKFSGLTAPILGENRADQLAEAALALDGAPNLAAFMRLAAPTACVRLAGD